MLATQGIPPMTREVMGERGPNTALVFLGHHVILSRRLTLGLVQVRSRTDRGGLATPEVWGLAQPYLCLNTLLAEEEGEQIS